MRSVAQPASSDALIPESPAGATESPVSPRALPAPAPPTDLDPRPLGPARDAKAAPAANADQPSAASALWNNPVVRTGGSLLIVLGLIFILAALAKRFGARGGSLAAAMGPGGRSPAGVLEVLGRYPIARGQTLILLKLDSRVLLLAQNAPRMRLGGSGAAGSLSTLCEITQPEDVASILVKVGEHEGESAGAKFQHLLASFDRRHAPDPDPSEPAHTEIDLRHIRQSEDGDRLETWDDQAAAPVVHRFPAAAPPASPSRERAERSAKQAGPSHRSGLIEESGGGPDSFGAIRQRLHALRGEAHR